MASKPVKFRRARGRLLTVLVSNVCCCSGDTTFTNTNAASTETVSLVDPTSNVYVCRMGLDYDFVKVLDFGLVGFSAGGLRSGLLSTDHVTLGTPAFMAPEQILGQEVDTRADVYSIGCVAYWLLTGQLVFAADSPMKMLMAHVEQIPPPPSHRVELPIPTELEAIVLACLDKNPDRRPQSAQVLWQSLVDCRGRETWTPEMARRWWGSHLPDLMSPQVLALPAVRPLSSGRV